MSERPYLCREWLLEDARDAVLKALDAWATGSGLLGLPAGSPGALDADLPALFNGIDAQVDRVIERAGAIMPDQPYPAAFVERTRISLEEILNRPRS